jgi:hypothetical protein
MNPVGARLSRNQAVSSEVQLSPGGSKGTIRVRGVSTVRGPLHRIKETKDGSAQFGHGSDNGRNGRSDRCDGPTLPVLAKAEAGQCQSRWSLVIVVAIFVSLIGLLAFVGVLLRTGPF